MRKTRSHERTGVLVGLGLLLVLASAAIVRDDVSPLVSPVILFALFIPAAAFSLLLRMRPETWGREGTYVDHWSIPHFLLGVFAFLLGLDLVYVVAIAAVWELIELAARVREYTTNRITDVALAVAGWLFVHVLVRVMA